MDVSQIINLANWSSENLPEISSSYGQLHQALDHNARQAQKQPLRDHLNGLTSLLKKMSFEHLTNEEIDLLRDLDTLKYLGQPGVEFVGDTVTTSDFDPASAATDIQAAVNNINQTVQKLKNSRASLSELGLEMLEDELILGELPLVRVRFKEEAALEDVSLLKNWTANWYDIARGAALSVGETPQSVKVVGAANGSVIITLATAASVTTVLAIIAKNAGRIASEVLSIANDIEDFRHKKRLNKVIEDELKRQQTAVQETGVEDTLSEIKETVPQLIENEVDNALRKSITKYFDFYKKGGDVDFIPPRIQPDTEDEDSEDQALLDQIAHQAQENERLVGVIEEVRAQHAELLKLVHHDIDEDV